MKSHVQRLFMGICLSCLTCTGTAIMVHSDGKEIAVAADSKRKHHSAPACKVRRIYGGVFFAASDTAFSITNTVTLQVQMIYDAYKTGVEAAAGLRSAVKMVERFSEMI